MTTYYVKTTGIDTDPGTSELEAWKTIAHAMSQVQPGDEVLMYTGTWNEQMISATNGTAANRITFKAAPGETPKITGSSGLINIALILDDYYTLDGLHFEHTNPPTTNDGWVLFNGAYPIIRNCKLTVNGVTSIMDAGQRWADGYREHGILLEAGCQHALVENNDVTGVVKGISIKAYNADTKHIIRGNFVHGTGQSNIVHATTKGNLAGTLIENNILIDSAIEDGIQFMPDYDSADIVNDISNLGVIIRGNIIRNPAENAIDLKGAGNIVIENNWIYGSIGSNDGGFDATYGWNTNAFGAVMHGNNTSSKHVIIRGNILYDNSNGTLLYNWYFFYHNTTLNNNRTYLGTNQTVGFPGSFTGVYQRQTGGTLVFSSKNNIIGGHNTNRNVTIRGEQPNVDFDMDGNIYVGGCADYNAGAGTTTFYTDINSWRSRLAAASGNYGSNDANSVMLSSYAELMLTNIPADNTAGWIQNTGATEPPYEMPLEHTNFNFAPMAGSPATNTAVPLTTTNGGGTGSIVVLQDSRYFFDGYGAVAGDTIMVDGNEAVITAINYDTHNVTLDRTITWSADAPVYWGNSSTPSKGASLTSSTPEPEPETQTLTPGYWQSNYWPAGYWSQDYWTEYGGTVIYIPPSDDIGKSKHRLTVHITDGPKGPIIEDYTGLIENNATFDTGPNGFDLVQINVNIHLLDAPLHAAKIYKKHISINAGPATIYSGRVDDISITPNGLQVTAYGDWIAMTDMLYTATWINTSIKSWEPLNSDIKAENQKYEVSIRGSIYIAPTKDETFIGYSDQAFVYTEVPHGSTRPIIRVRMHYKFKGSSDWRFVLQRRDDNLDWLSTPLSFYGDDTQQEGDIDLIIDPAHSISLSLQPLADLNYTGETGWTYLVINDVRVQTIDTDNVTIDQIAKDLVAHTRLFNPNELSASIAQIQTDNNPLHQQVFKDMTPAKILEEITPPNWQAAIWTEQILHLVDKTEPREWYTEINDTLQITITDDKHATDAYTVYQAPSGRELRTDNTSNIPRLSLANIHRQISTKSKTTDLTEAEKYRDDQLDAAKTHIATTITLFGLYDEHGTRYELWELHSGDRLTIWNIPPHLERILEGLESFIVERTTYDMLADTLRPTTQVDRSIEFLISQ